MSIGPLVEETCTSETKGENSTRFYGVYPDVSKLKRLLDKSFVQVNVWCEPPYRYVWVSLEHSTVATFSDGDVSVIVFDRDDDFLDHLADCQRFYLEWRGERT